MRTKVKMLKKYRRIVCLVFAFFFFLILVSVNPTNKRLNDLSLEKESQINDNVFVISNEKGKDFIDNEYQDSVEDLIELKKKEKIYTLSNPLFIMNPYGTITNGMYIYFKTFFEYRIEYTVSVMDKTIPDFTNTLPGDKSRNHEGLILGLIQGQENIITLRLIDDKNEIKKEYVYKINLPDYNTNSIKRIDSEIYVDEDEISDGLYIATVVLATQDFEYVPLGFYDKYGILRVELSKMSGHKTYNLLFIDDKIFYPVGLRTYALVNKFGKMTNIYNVDSLTDHDNIYDEKRF